MNSIPLLCVWAALTWLMALEGNDAIPYVGRSVDSDPMVTVFPEEYPHALRNPLKGFRNNLSEAQRGYGTLARHYIKWNELENHETDSIQKIKDFCNQAWDGVEEMGVKVIPRIYLDWDEAEGNEHWPDDMVEGDYTSEQFKQRVKRLVARLGECWDNDPRVAWVQMGIVGYWGEHHHPEPSAEIEAILGEAFSAAFKNKKVLVRRPVDFEAFAFGFYWDSWAHIQQIDRKEHGAGIEALNEAKGRWKTHPIEGETAYNWGQWREQPGDDPNDTLSDPEHREFLIDSIRNLHCSGLGWVSRYDPSFAGVEAGAAEVQKAFGYRFVVSEFACSREVKLGGELSLSFEVRNDGSAPFYEKWPLEFSLLDPETREPVWRTVLSDVDIRDWLPGDDWDEEKNVYLRPAKTNRIETRIALPDRAQLPNGAYIAALAILDPVGGTPQVRFAVRNYFEGGRHPFARVGVGLSIEGDASLDAELFDDPMGETRLGYALTPTVALGKTAGVRCRIDARDGLVRLYGQAVGIAEPLLVQRSTSFVRGDWETVRVLPGLETWFQLTERVRSQERVQFFRVTGSGDGEP